MGHWLAIIMHFKKVSIDLLLGMILNLARIVLVITQIKYWNKNVTNVMVRKVLGIQNFIFVKVSSDTSETMQNMKNVEELRIKNVRSTRQKQILVSGFAHAANIT